ncbi:tRNA(Met) cytidine acetate ligase [Butyrivibrio sp. FCS014]|uniref:tRNA(Met) cytidine acetate ligase n=1 Tax=Butyrivibrio sp. FCS014 TaxID=1408304 RepID=UPI0004635173|nr:nucleotidyltransferase family protein [Butyrivibrio sp. FCS014]
MKTIGIIAEFNPFHNGHKYLIDHCKRALSADRVVIVMSGDYVQRGAPAITDKFTRTRMALNCGADLVLELPIYYSLGSAEYFAEGAISILDKLGCIDYLCFGSESPDPERLQELADILSLEPALFKKTLEKCLKDGDSFPLARKKALDAVLISTGRDASSEDTTDVLTAPNNILAIEYLRSLKRRKSSIKPYIIQRIGQPYHSDTTAEIPSASSLRALLLSNGGYDSKSHAPEILKGMVPLEAAASLVTAPGNLLNVNDFSDLLYYKLVMEKDRGYTRYLDVNRDISNRLVKSMSLCDGFSSFCELMKTRNLVYTRVSRCLMHIMLDITEENMSAYKKDGFTAYARVLGMKKDSSDLPGAIHDKGSIPLIDRLKDAGKLLSPLQLQLLEETLKASEVYSLVSNAGISGEYSLKQIIL